MDMVLVSIERKALAFKFKCLKQADSNYFKQFLKASLPYSVDNL